MALSEKNPLFREVDVYMNRESSVYFRKSFLKYSDHFKGKSELHHLLRGFVFLIKLRDYISEQIVEDTLDLMDEVIPHLIGYVDDLVDTMEAEMERSSQAKVGIKCNIYAGHASSIINRWLIFHK